jgi:HNH endonuclease
MFQEVTKLAVKRRAHFACCVCHEVGVEVHHIVPQAESGVDDEANAAPLCPSCHETYGANPTKRKFIRETRDLWYEICATRFAPDPDRIAALERGLAAVATKSDLEAAVSAILAAGGTDSNNAVRRETELADEPASAANIRLYLRWMYPTLRHCGADRCADWEADLSAIGLTTIGDLHDVLWESKDVVSEFVQEKRDTGIPADHVTDSFPLELFLAILDERYCQLRHPAVHATIKLQHPWRRPAA